MSGKEVAYTWRENSIINADANCIGPELEELHELFDHVTPDILVEAARDPNSAMHEYFDWDDSVAARKWRKQQGRFLLNSIRIVSRGDPTPRIMNVSVKLVGGGRGYKKTTVAVEEQTMWDQVMGDARESLRGVQRRLEDLIAVETSARKKRATYIRDAVKAAHALIEQQGNPQ